MSDFPEFCSQQPLKIFQKFLNRIVAQTSNLYAIIFDSVKNAQFLSEMRYSDPTHRKVGIFSHIFARPPPGGETCEILLANYKGPPMPFHYLYNWLLPLARFRKSRPDKNRYRKKRKSTLQNIRRCADRPASQPTTFDGAASMCLPTARAVNK